MATNARKGGWDFFLAKGGGPVGVVLIHEIYGYNPYIEVTAKALGSAGVSTAAVDLYKGRLAASLEEGRMLKEAVARDALADALRSGAELLKEAGAVRTGAMGFCMGGGFALQGACDLGLDFAVDYYGMIPAEDDVARLKGPVLLILGSDDERITPWAFQKLLPAAMKHKKRVEVELYPNCKHAFHRPGGEAHNPEAAADAWDKTIRFLEQFR
jgi:carboxymethylenebutenolidase